MYFLHCIPVLRFCPTFITILLVFCTTTYILTTKKINVFVCNIRIRSFFWNILVHKRQSLLPKYHTKPVYETVGKSSLPFFLVHCICTVSWIFFLWNHPNQPAEVKLLASYIVKENPQSMQFLLNGIICDPPQDFDANTCKGAVVFKFIGKSNERILCKLSKSKILRLYSMVHVAMETFNQSLLSVYFSLG